MKNSINRFLISIIIPVYNVEKYISQCLNSLENQELDNVEVIVINDGSTDDSGEICREFFQKFSNLKVIDQMNSGLSSARNVGINCANGEYLLFLDSDDWLNKDALKNLKIILKQSKPDIILGRAISIDDRTGERIHFVNYNNIKAKNSSTELFYKLLKKKGFWFAAWLLIVKRDFIVRNSLMFHNGIFHEDELWVPQCFLKCSTVSLFDEEFYCYRINRQNSIINQTNIKKELDKLIVIEKLLSEKVMHGYSEKIIKERTAALEWGLISNFKKYGECADKCVLLNGIKQNLKCLKYGKYFLLYFYAKIFSLKRLVGINKT